MGKEKKELSPEDMQAVAQALTKVNRRFCQSMQAVAECISETFQIPEYRALLAALPDPEPEEEEEGEEDDLNSYTCMDYDPVRCGHKCLLVTTLDPGQYLRYCPDTGKPVVWKCVNTPSESVDKRWVEHPTIDGKRA